MQYGFIKTRGALGEGLDDSGVDVRPQARPVNTKTITDLDKRRIPQELVQLIPESIARHEDVIAVSEELDGRIVVACGDPDDITLADRLRFSIAKEVELTRAPRSDISRAVARHYASPGDRAVAASVIRTGSFGDAGASTFDDGDSLDDSSDDHNLAYATAHPPMNSKAMTRARSQVRRKAALSQKPKAAGFDVTTPVGDSGMFFYTVEEGRQTLMRRPNGTMEVLVGPRRVWRGSNVFRPMDHYVAHPGEFLIVRNRDGSQMHLAGPNEVWFDPRTHESVTREECLQIAAKEAVVVYSKDEQDGDISRRVVHGPTLFVPQPGEWLHTFSWHASKGGSKGVQKIPNGLVFQKLWLMPDQMYHDVTDVRTSDDAVLTVRLMLFFELLDIERMLETTHDPIGDFVNAATADVVEFVGRFDFESFKQNTDHLNELDTYRQLTSRASQCGYRINNVVYRGYGAPESLQQMHDQAIETRTRLQLERATEEQAQDLEDYKLNSQLARAAKRREEQTDEVRHDLELSLEKTAAELKRHEAEQNAKREQTRLAAELQDEIQRRKDATRQEFLERLKEMNVDLTQYLTQNRADRVIEVRGKGTPHLHLDEQSD